MRLFYLKFLVLLISSISIFSACKGLSDVAFKKSIIGSGWANNSINTVIFRQNAVTTHRNTQFVAYYDAQSYVTLAKRTLPAGDWEVHKTQYTGNTADAHNVISIAVDGDGYLHISWDHHDNELRYAVSVEPLSLVLGAKKQMTGIEEGKVSYPQFYNLKNSGDLIFMYRSGQSGRGILVINSYDIKTGVWSQLHQNLIDGEGKRNAYWQAYVDKQGTIHVSWVWRETWDVSTNHDIAYAKSTDGGKTWTRSTGEAYELPITQETAENAWEIPQNSSLINQTSMTTDDAGNPYIANYWNVEGKTQYQIVYLENGIWKKQHTSFRDSGFDLGGGGTKKIPISRPEIFVQKQKSEKTVYLLFRDDLRESKITIAYKNLASQKDWKLQDLTDISVGDWEPNFDKQLYKQTGKVHIFQQEVIQVDGEGLIDKKATPVQLLELDNLPLN
ncbi:BNR repeat-containing protein [Leeuwenhoekiella marinoflava]|uniref:BNR repeat-containing family member n=2 Tax=Leeuwenhoekiella marinoflava TaxID=988 RepID=A0ABY1HY58_9FLAO|nr:BNR repeat-containing protein [Leeuwenhoekiella marinoflava]RXG27179.1 putative BNR repeat neuraminidase [Leeuwenhoekiella marinoflava]SHF77806.1 BNR repeat-containing family member [Leeuwenhoekiella marinoflava DSM 3653]